MIGKISPGSSCYYKLDHVGHFYWVIMTTVRRAGPFFLTRLRETWRNKRLRFFETVTTTATNWWVFTVRRGDNKCRNNSNPNSPDGDESYDKFLYFLLSGRMIRIECVDLFKMRSLPAAPGSNYILIEHLSLVSSPQRTRPIKLQQVIFHVSGCFPARWQCQQWQVRIFTFFLSSPSFQPTNFSLAPKTLIGLKSMLGWIHFEISWMKEVLDPTVICKYV